MEKVIECVPNFSEGRDRETIGAIAEAAGSVSEAYVLHVDSGVAAHRTVVTFAGEPGAVVEAAFRAVEVAARRIDMRRHRGEHPRIGATDVLPLVPVRGVSLEECAGLARTGATVIGARNFLGAVNFNLASSGNQAADVALAREIAREIRAASGTPWSLPTVKAIGWWIEEYGCAQVSTNLTDMHVTGIGTAYRAVVAAAERRGTKVTGTEVIGLLPEWALVEATDERTVSAAVKALGLDSMRHLGRGFDPARKIVERLLK